MSKTPLALTAVLLLASSARAQVSRKPVASDDRITDATIEFDDSKYPTTPVAALTFWGFVGAKTDESPDQDRLCDMDVAELAINTGYATKRIAGRPGAVRVSKTIVTSTVERCDDREIPKGGYAPPPSCAKYTVKHCAATLTSYSPNLRLQYKMIAKRGTDKACREALIGEMAKNAVIDSAISPVHNEGGRFGCALKVLEIVAAD